MSYCSHSFHCAHCSVFWWHSCESSVRFIDCMFRILFRQKDGRDLFLTLMISGLPVYSDCFVWIRRDCLANSMLWQSSSWCWFNWYVLRTIELDPADMVLWLYITRCYATNRNRVCAVLQSLLCRFSVCRCQAMSTIQHGNRVAYMASDALPACPSWAGHLFHQAMSAIQHGNRIADMASDALPACPSWAFHTFRTWRNHQILDTWACW